MHERVTEFLAIIMEPKESNLIRVVSEFFPEMSFMSRERHYLTGAIFLLQEGGNIDLIRGKAPSEIGPIVSQQVDTCMAEFIRQMETLLPVCRDMGLIQRGLIFLNAVKQQIAVIPFIQEFLRLMELISGTVLECLYKLKDLYRNNAESLDRLLQRCNMSRLLNGMSFREAVAAVSGVFRSYFSLVGMDSSSLGMVLGLGDIDGPE